MLGLVAALVVETGDPVSGSWPPAIPGHVSHPAADTCGDRRKPAVPLPPTAKRLKPPQPAKRTGEPTLRRRTNRDGEACASPEEKRRPKADSTGRPR